MISLKAAAGQVLPSLRERALKLAAMGRLGEGDAAIITAKVKDLEAMISQTEEATDDKERREF